jgi:hypothetical protein
VLRAIVFLGLITSAPASATLDVLVNAAASFSATIQQQLEMLQSNPSPAEIAEKTIDYAEAKAAYFKALRDEMPELIKMATGKEPRPSELDTFAAAFAVAGEKQEKVADEEPLVLLKRFSRNPTLRRRGRSSSVLKESKRDSIRTSMSKTSLVVNAPFALEISGDRDESCVHLALFLSFWVLELYRKQRGCSILR